MEIILLTLLVGVIIIVVFLGWIKGKSHENQSLFLLQQQMDALRQQMSESLANHSNQVNLQLNSITQHLQTTSGTIGDRLDNAAKVVGEVRQNLGELTKATERVFEVGKNISSLQEILQAPKLRGVLGELFLGDLLHQILPHEHYALQYRFKSGEMVDAVIKLGTGLVPIDSKFPLENFRRILDSQNDEEKRTNQRKFYSDLKKHIDAIADKYILPQEGTFPFALMYLPAENVYYETIVKDEAQGEEKSIAAYALKRKVIPVSPHSFYAYLQAIVFGLKGLRVEQSALSIIKHLEQLKGDLDRFRKEFATLGSHLSNAKGKYDEADKRLNRIEGQFALGEELHHSQIKTEDKSAENTQRELLKFPS